MNVGEVIAVTTVYDKERNGTDMTIQETKYIMGITAEKTEINSTLQDLVKILSKEEWKWVSVSHKEIKIERIPTYTWSPLEDPRPEWRIKETQLQTLARRRPC